MANKKVKKEENKPIATPIIKVEEKKEIIKEPVKIAVNYDSLNNFYDVLKKHAKIIGIDKVLSYLKKHLLRELKNVKHVDLIIDKDFNLSDLPKNIFANGINIQNFLKEVKTPLEKCLKEYGYNNVVKYLNI